MSIQNRAPQIESLIARTNLSVPFEDFLSFVVASSPNLGSLRGFKPILEGYEDANIYLQTDTGEYVLKIFSKDRTVQNVKDYAKVLEVAPTTGVPVIQLVFGTQGNLGTFENGGKPVYYLITKFFSGANFESRTPSRVDVFAVTEFIAKLNTLDFPVDESYDSWGNKNLLKEYLKSRNKLTNEQDQLLKPCIERFQSFDLSKCSKAVIHGDMQRKHVLKNDSGEYAILDFGCMSHDAKIIELSTFIAWFCLAPDTWDEREEIVQEVIKIYLQTHHLSEYEVSGLPILIEAAHASYFLRTSILRAEGDQSSETEVWWRQSQEMLMRMQDWTGTLIDLPSAGGGIEVSAKCEF